MGADVWLVARWWGALFIVGAAALPLTKLLFRTWYDEGYLFAKAVGLATVTWLVYVIASVRILPFALPSIVVSLIVLFFSGIALGKFGIQFKISRDAGFRIALNIPRLTRKGRSASWGSTLLRIGVEELFFFAALLLWSWVKGHEPSIRSLEKFMDFGFMQSAVTNRYFPPRDMWYAGYPINYYYFGHIATALLSLLSGVELRYGFNIMLATIFAFTFTMSFAIAYEIFTVILAPARDRTRHALTICGSFLTGFIVTLGGNLQTIYAFTKGYSGEDVKPFWELLWPVSQFWQRLPEGLNRYWYANATRFIPFSIHEFPSYSFVVSDVHGHVLSLPFVLLAVALLVYVFGVRKQESDNSNMLFAVFFGFLTAILLMTNALDGPIYFGLMAILAAATRKSWKSFGITIGTAGFVAILVSLPFVVHFKSFVTGLALDCPPVFLANSRAGPLLFESIDKCQRSPLWMLLILWGFFLYCGTWFIATAYDRGKQEALLMHRVLTIFFFFSLALIIFPEFFYFKDIYPAHFRSNTMFKLGYQAFILFSIVSGIQITRMIVYQGRRILRALFFLFLIPLLFLVSIYPIFSVRSYFNGLKTYEGLDGLAWLSRDYPDDYRAIEWLKEEIRDRRQETGLRNCGTFPNVSLVPCPLSPVLVEADGDSYTDYDRFSVFTGMPTIVGWAVHEWLWRGTYDVVAPRREEVRFVYESLDVAETQRILHKYGVTYVVIGTLERERYPGLWEAKFASLSRPVFRSGTTVIYKLFDTQN